MRILGIETSSARGSVALLEDGRSIGTLSHERENAHGESILPLIQQALAAAGWSRTQLDRVAVGTGPGSFTGLRVGIAIAQGLAEGLELPLIGVPSLEAMARAVPAERGGPRCVLVDARKGELFMAAYDASGRELLPVQLVASPGDVPTLTLGLPGAVFVGNGAALVTELGELYRSPETDLPHARWTALVASDREPAASVRPLYLRDAVAVVPKLPADPLRAAPGNG